MTFLFDPENTEKKKFICFPPGEYEIEIEKATSKISKTSGNPMLELQITAYDITGKKVFIYDYIVAPTENSQGSLYKLERICEICGLEYSGKLEEESLVGKRMKAKLTLKAGCEKWPEKNLVLEYLSGSPTKTPTDTPPMPKEDDIPF